MTLYETIKYIETIARQQPNVNTIVESGDIFDLNKEEYEVEYAAFCCTQRTHFIVTEDGGDFTQFNFTLYYVDRLRIDESDKLFIQSTAVEVLSNIKRQLADKVDGMMEIGDITTFTQRFTSECAGAYMNLTVTTIANGSDDCFDDYNKEIEAAFDRQAFENESFS